MIYRFPALREILAQQHYGTTMALSQGSPPCFKHLWLKCMLIIACLSVLLMSLTFVSDGRIWNHNPNSIAQLRFKFYDIATFDRVGPFSPAPKDPVVNVNVTEDNFDALILESLKNGNLIRNASAVDSTIAVLNSDVALKSSSHISVNTPNMTRYPVSSRSTTLSYSAGKGSYGRNSTVPSVRHQKSAIDNSSEYFENDGNNTTDRFLPLCPKDSPLLVGPIAPSMSVVTDQQILAANPDLRPGGLYKPPNCGARNKVAVIVVYRDRKEHLQIFLTNIHPVLQKQQLDYGVFIVEQAGSSAFNRGVLFNAGYKEVRRAYDYECFVMHDVDLLPENDRNPYSCPAVPTLLAPAISSSQYRMPYNSYFGAAVSFTAKQFSRINGFANVYWGWGGEDDDLNARVRSRYRRVGQSPPELGRYRMIKHGKDKGNPDNPERFNLMGTATERFLTDGLSNVNYTVLATEARPLYTWFLVDIGLPPDNLPAARTYSTGGLWGG